MENNEIRYQAQLDQAGISFGEIASTADCIEGLCIEAIASLAEPGYLEVVGNQLNIIKKLAAQVGLISDVTSRKIGQAYIRGGAEEWLFPPTWHWAAEKIAANPEIQETDNLKHN